jgi:hypothetical protein
MSKCDLSYFTRCTWTVIDPPVPFGEEKDHKIKIQEVGGGTVQVSCQGGHKPLSGVFNENLGRIENQPGAATWSIVCKKGVKNRIVFAMAADPHQPGTWTAEDSGNDGE